MGIFLKRGARKLHASFCFLKKMRIFAGVSHIRTAHQHPLGGLVFLVTFVSDNLSNSILAHLAGYVCGLPFLS